MTPPTKSERESFLSTQTNAAPAKDLAHHGRPAATTQSANIVASNAAAAGNTTTTTAALRPSSTSAPATMSPPPSSQHDQAQPQTPAPTRTHASTQTQTQTQTQTPPEPAAPALPRAELAVHGGPQPGEPTFKQLTHEHRATTERLQDLAMAAEKYAGRVAARVKNDEDAAMGPVHARVAYLITRVVVDKDRAMLRSAEAELQRTVHSLWKLDRELRAAGGEGGEQRDVDHDMYELLEGFVGAMSKTRGEDREAWGDAGKELGALLDTMKAEMEWWDKED